LNTGIHRSKTNTLIYRLTDYDGAGAAIALGATFLATDTPDIFSQVLQHGAGRIDVLDFDQFSV
jgi:hypothetical protein